jgi:hypothetical protein
MLISSPLNPFHDAVGGEVAFNEVRQSAIEIASMEHSK